MIEIMLVVVLISITISLVNLSIEPKVSALLYEEARRFTALLNHAQDESIMTGRPIAIEVDAADKSYKFLEINDSEWKAIEKDDIFRSRNWSQRINAKLTIIQVDPVPGTNEEEKEPLQRIVIEAVGSTTPFELEFSAEDESVMINLNEAGRGEVLIDDRIK